MQFIEFFISSSLFSTVLGYFYWLINKSLETKNEEFLRNLEMQKIYSKHRLEKYPALYSSLKILQREVSKDFEQDEKAQARYIEDAKLLKERVRGWEKETGGSLILSSDLSKKQKKSLDYFNDLIEYLKKVNKLAYNKQVITINLVKQIYDCIINLKQELNKDIIFNEAEKNYNKTYKNQKIWGLLYNIFKKDK